MHLRLADFNCIQMLIYYLFKFCAITYDIIDYFIFKPYERYTDDTLQSKIIKIIKYDLKNLHAVNVYDVPRWKFHYFNFNRFLFKYWPTLHVDSKINQITSPDPNIIYEVQFFRHNTLYRDIGLVLSNQSIYCDDEPIFKSTMVLYAGIHNTCNITAFFNEYWDSFNSLNNMNVIDVLKLSYIKKFISTHDMMYVLSNIIHDSHLSITLNDKCLSEISFKKSDTIITKNV